MNINFPAFRKALQDVEKMNTPHQWAEMTVLTWPPTNIGDNTKETYRIKIDYGTIHSDGQKERAIGTLEYTMRGDFVNIHRQTHA